MKNKYFIIKKEECRNCEGKGGEFLGIGTGGHVACSDCLGKGVKEEHVDLESVILDIIKTNSGSINMALQRAYLK